MCKAKARVAECGHTVAYEIMIPCKNYTGGPPCAAWDEKLMNKALLMDSPIICVECHIQKEKKICKGYVNGERDLVRFAEDRGETPKEIWEARLVKGAKMQADVRELDRKIGREGIWREKSRRADWSRI